MLTAGIKSTNKAGNISKKNYKIKKLALKMSKFKGLDFSKSLGLLDELQDLVQHSKNENSKGRLFFQLGTDYISSTRTKRSSQNGKIGSYRHDEEGPPGASKPFPKKGYLCRGRQRQKLY